MNNQRLNFGYVPALDGIRGFAIVFVMLFHAGLVFFKDGGFLGVDVFFCLSGYLITLGLLKEYKNFQRVDFKSFYIRRILRLIPALVLLLIAFNVYSFFAYETAEFQHNAQSSLISLFYVTNIVKMLNLTATTPLTHTWSLAMEEQFYLVWPLTLLILFRLRLSWKRLLTVVLAMALGSFLLGVYLLTINMPWFRVYFGPDTRFYEILVGCALAIIVTAYQNGQLTRLIKVKGSVASLAAFAVLLMALFAHDEPSVYYLVMPATILATALLILHLISPEPSAIKRMLEFKGLVLLGRISYSLYLYHAVILIIIVHGLNQRLFIGIPLSIALSLLSYYAVEQRILKLKSRFQPASNTPSLIVPASENA